jgi:hypothetical protein
MTTNDTDTPRPDVAELAADAKSLKRALQRRDILIGTLSVLTIALIVLSCFVIVRLDDVKSVVKDLHNTAQGNHQLQQETANNTGIIKDCTQPTGKCFQASQKRAQALVGSVSHGVACDLINDLGTTAVLTPQQVVAARAREHC